MKVSFKINRHEAVVPGAKAPRSPRRRVLVTGMFQSLTTSCKAAVRNLSCTGASIECDVPVKVGAEGVLRAGELDCLCRVVWRKGQVYGIKFDQPLHNSVVLDLHKITESDIQREQSAAVKEWYEIHSR